VANYRLLIKASAAKELESLPRKDRQRVADRIRSLSVNPRPTGSEKLTDADRYRLRQGDYRILYEIHDREVIVIVVKLGSRRDVYR